MPNYFLISKKKGLEKKVALSLRIFKLEDYQGVISPLYFLNELILFQLQLFQHFICLSIYNPVMAKRIDVYIFVNFSNFFNGQARFMLGFSFHYDFNMAAVHFIMVTAVVYCFYCKSKTSILSTVYSLKKLCRPQSHNLVK